MREIGGYFGLELQRGSEFHRGAIRLNSGRSCLAYLLAADNVKRLYLPFYLCDTLIEVIQDAGIEYSFYPIDATLEIAEELLPGAGERLLYVNYFGLKGNYVEHLAERYGSALIIDNSQAFFARPLAGIDTFYSPRKFFGVADGGYLYTDKRLERKLEPASSTANALHLLGRIDSGAQAWYQAYLKAEAALGEQGLMQMSRLSQSLLDAVDYDTARSRRERNFEYLHGELAAINRIPLIDESVGGAMVYPFMGAIPGLREALLQDNVYVATYWREVLEREGVGTVERELVEAVIPLPVDQRYDIKDMQRIVHIIKSEIDE